MERKPRLRDAFAEQPGTQHLSGILFQRYAYKRLGVFFNDKFRALALSSHGVKVMNGQLKALNNARTRHSI